MYDPSYCYIKIISPCPVYWHLIQLHQSSSFIQLKGGPCTNTKNTRPWAQNNNTYQQKQCVINLPDETIVYDFKKCQYFKSFLSEALLYCSKNIFVSDWKQFVSCQGDVIATVYCTVFILLVTFI